MGNATKVALVALLILLVVVVARFVREDSTPDTEVTTAQKPAGSIQSNLPGKVPARTTAPVSSTGQAKAVAPTTVASTTQPGASTTTSPTAGSRVLPQTTPGASTSLPAGSTPSGGSRVISSQPATQPSTPSALASQPLSGSAAAQPGASTVPTNTASTVTPTVAPTTLPPPPPSSAGHSSSGPSLVGGSRTDLPPPNPIGSLTPSSGTARTPEDTSAARVSPVVVSQLPPGRPTGGASSPFRSLAESHDGGRSSASDGGLSSGTAREASAPEKSSSTTRITENDAAPGAPASGDGGLKTGYPKTHVVAKGDTYWGLADHFYGSGSLLHVLEKANPGVKLRPGVKITIPAPPAEARPAVATATTGTSAPKEPRAPEKAAAPQGSRDYVVQKGDTLGLIAKKFYGDSSKLHLIEQANPDLRYQMLQAGARIKVPAAGDR